MAFATIFQGIAWRTVHDLFGYNPLADEDLTVLMNANDDKSYLTQKWVNFWGQIGTFLIPALLFARVFKSPIAGSYFPHTKFPAIKWIALYTLPIVLLPISELLSEMNLNLLPASFQTDTETSFISLVDRVTTETSFSAILLNTILFAFLPGVAEELFFRGVLQKLMTKITWNVHAGIFTTSFLFTFVHFRFNSFIPLFCLSTLLGYLVVWTSSIKTSIIVHSLYNLYALLVEILLKSTDWEFQILQRLGLATICLVLAFLLVRWISRPNRLNYTLHHYLI